LTPTDIVSCRGKPWQRWKLRSWRSRKVSVKL